MTKLEGFNSGALELEEKRLLAARDEAGRQLRGQRCEALNKKLSKVRVEINRRKRLGTW